MFNKICIIVSLIALFGIFVYGLHLLLEGGYSMIKKKSKIFTVMFLIYVITFTAFILTS